MMKFLKQHKLLCFHMLAVLIWHVLLLLGVPFITTILGLYIVLILPGIISVSLLGARRLTLSTGVIATGVSIALALCCGILANFVPRIFGIQKPLSLASVLICFDILLLALSMTQLLAHTPAISLPTELFVKKQTVIITFLAVLGLLFCIFGTFRLNNGASNFMSVAGLVLLIINCGLTLVWRRKVSTFAFAISLGTLTAGLLLVTSLRSYWISGQDLKQEYRVFTIMSNRGMWSVNNLQDSYNACLSITLLPFTLSKLLGVEATVVFKFIFQILFVLCPLAIFGYARPLLGRSLAYLGGLFFIALPTLGLDLPLQARQQVAFVFLSLSLLCWLAHDEPWLKRKWQGLFLLFSAGTILSHYSTSYLFVAMLALYGLISLAYKLFQHQPAKPVHFILSGKLIVLVVLMAFLWLGQTTSATGNLYNKLGSSLHTFFQNRSPDTMNDKDNSLVGGGGHSLDDYVQRTKPSDSPQSESFPKKVILVDDTLKPAALLKSLPKPFVTLSSSLSKKIYYTLGSGLYLFTIIGGIVLLMTKSGKVILEKRRIEYVWLSVCAILLLGLQAVLPNITLDYGITRAFIQMFLIFVIPFLLLLKLIIDLFGKIGRIAIGFAALLLLLTYSGLISQFLGGTRPQLNFNNAGPYYGSFYTHAGDIRAFGWLDKNVPGSGNVNSPDYSLPTALAYYPGYKHYGGGIFPFQNVPNHYALLNYPQTQKGVTYISGALQAAKINYSEFTNLNIVYTNGTSRVYR